MTQHRKTMAHTRDTQQNLCVNRSSLAAAAPQAKNPRDFYAAELWVIPQVIDGLGGPPKIDRIHGVNGFS